MPEGHTLHRLAADLRDRFTHAPVRASSPQGRFVEGAARIDGHPLGLVEAHGKHVFAQVGDTDEWLHIHLGLIGTMRFGAAPAPAPVGAVRLRLESDEQYADLRGATTCALITTADREAIMASLGPDPLRDDADPERAWTRLHRSRLPIGQLLMDQTVLSGVGNVYRAEILFRARLHPLTPGDLVRRKEWDAIWADIVTSMRLGRATGRIDTVTAEHTPEAMGRDPRVDDHGGEVYVYRRDGLPCLVCGTIVRTKILAGRNLFWCPRDQRTGLTRRRSTATSKATSKAASKRTTRAKTTAKTSAATP